MGMDGVANWVKRPRVLLSPKQSHLNPEIGQIVNIFQIGANQYRFEVLGFHFVSC